MKEEALIVEAARAGDRSAFAELYDRYSRPLFLWLAGRLRTREDAEDELHAVLLRAWKALPRLRRPDRFGPWLFRIARRRLSDHHRRGTPVPVPLTGREDLLGATRDPGCDTDGIRAALAGLRPESRSLVLLRAVEGLPAEEVARLLGVHPATVRRRYARALAQLRRTLDGRNHDA